MIKRLFFVMLLALFTVVGVFAQDEQVVEAPSPQFALVVNNTFDGELVKNDDDTYTLTLLTPENDYDFINLRELDTGVITTELFGIIMESSDISMDAVLEVDDIKIYFSLTPIEQSADGALVFAAEINDAVANDADASVKLPDVFEGGKMVMGLSIEQVISVSESLEDLGIRSTKWTCC